MDFSTDNVVKFSDELLNLMQEEATFERVKEILDSSYLHYQTDSSGATLLHYAAQYNNTLVIQYLLDKEIDIDVHDSMGTTPLMIGVTQSHEPVIQMLLSAGADIFKLNKKNENVLHMMSVQYAMKSSTVEILLQELKKKCSTNQEITEKLIDANCELYHAIVLRDAEIIYLMIHAEQSREVSYAHPINKLTAMHSACMYDDLSSVKVLIEFGADINALDIMNETPFCKVYKDNAEHNNEKIEIIKILLNQGASKTSCISDGRFQVHHILTRGNREAVLLLLESGLDFKIKDQSQKSVIHYLASNINPGVIEELSFYANKLNVDSCDQFGQTALLFAAYEGNIDMVKFLLNKNAKVDLRHNLMNISPLHYAYANMKPGLAFQYKLCGRALLQHNADPQCIVVTKTGERLSIFDDSLRNRNFKRIMPVIAHLAILEKRGTQITDQTWAKINSLTSLKEYFNDCQDILTMKISGKVKLFNLLTSNVKKMAMYLNNENIVKRLEKHSCYEDTLKSHRYYYHCLNRLVYKAKRYNQFKIRAAKVICRIFRKCINETHFITEKVIDFLDDESLKQLCLLNRQLSHESEKY